MYSRICIREYPFFSEAINFIRPCSKFHTVIMLSNFINLIKTIIEINEFTNCLSTSALIINFLNINIIYYSNKYQGVFHPIKLHSCLSSFPNFLLFLSRWQVNAMPTLSSFIAVTDEPEANNMTPRPTQ